MSWQSYVDSSLIGTGKIDSCALFSGAGDSVWANSPGFSSLVNAFGDASSLSSHGIYFNGQRYLLVATNERSIHGKKDNEGVYAFKTNQTLILAHSPEGVGHGEALKVVETLGDYLIGLGY
ncbi:hypothetical protein BJX96DRAFT_167719 [Aspergillus floccosus]